MSGYVKLFSSILDSTVWLTPAHVRLVWITMMAMADRDGVVEASVPGLAVRAGVTRAECDDALAVLGAPDPDSRSPAHEGRRILKIDGGWELVNHTKYRQRMGAEDRKERDAARKSKKRAEERVTSADSPQESADVRACPDVSATVRDRPGTSADVPEVSHAEASPSPSPDEESTPPPMKPPRTQPGELGRVANLVQQAAIAGYRDAGLPPPRETRDMSWKGWADVARWLLDSAELQGWPEDWRDHRPAWIVDRFLTDPWAEKRGYPIAHLASNPAEYALRKTEAA